MFNLQTTRVSLARRPFLQNSLDTRFQSEVLPRVPRWYATCSISIVPNGRRSFARSYLFTFKRRRKLARAWRRRTVAARRRVSTLRRSARCLAASSAPLLYRGITGHWPAVLNGITQPDNTRTALGGRRAVCTCANRFGWKCRSPTSTGSGVASRTCRDS